MNLHSKKIIVTGATSGIGRHTAFCLAKRGAQVVMIGRSHSKLLETLSSLEGDGHQMFELDFELTDVNNKLKELFKLIGPVDGFFHCAGVHLAVPIKVTDTDSVRKLYNVNVFSAIDFVKELRKKNNHNSGCSVVLMSSASAMLGEAALSAYSSSKGAILSLTRSLAAELASDNIRVNCISAGIVQTELTDNLFKKLDDKTVNKIKSSHLLGFGEVDDVSEAAIFLLSPSSKWITGSNLVVDGGFTAVK